LRQVRPQEACVHASGSTTKDAQIKSWQRMIFR